MTAAVERMRVGHHRARPHQRPARHRVREVAVHADRRRLQAGHEGALARARSWGIEPEKVYADWQDCLADESHRRLRGPAAPPHAPRGGAGGPGDGQAPLHPEAGGLHGGRVPAVRGGGGCRHGARPGRAGLRELPLLPARRASWWRSCAPARSATCSPSARRASPATRPAAGRCRPGRRSGASTWSATAADRSSSTTACTSSASSGRCSAWPTRSTPGSAPRRWRAGHSIRRRSSRCAGRPGRWARWRSSTRPKLQVQSIFYSQDDRVEVSGTKGVAWVNRGHGKIQELPALQVYKRRPHDRLRGPAERVGQQLHPGDARLHRGRARGPQHPADGGAAPRGALDRAGGADLGPRGPGRPSVRGGLTGTAPGRRGSGPDECAGARRGPVGAGMPPVRRRRVRRGRRACVTARTAQASVEATRTPARGSSLSPMTLAWPAGEPLR